MIETIRPRGAIANSLFKKTRIVRGHYCIVDVQDNIYVVSKDIYYSLGGTDDDRN